MLVPGPSSPYGPCVSAGTRECPTTANSDKINTSLLHHQQQVLLSSGEMHALPVQHFLQLAPRAATLPAGFPCEAREATQKRDAAAEATSARTVPVDGGTAGGQMRPPAGKKSAARESSALDPSEGLQPLCLFVWPVVATNLRSQRFQPVQRPLQSGNCQASGQPLPMVPIH